MNSFINIIKTQSAFKFLFGFNLVFFLFLFFPIINFNPVVKFSVIVIGLFFLIINIQITLNQLKSKTQLVLTWVPIKSHYIQALVQTTVFVFWATYWPPIITELPLIVLQLIFGYLLEAILFFRSEKNYRLGFGLFPIILSINLFLWFRVDYFFLQFLLVATAILGKKFVRWNMAGKNTHIFNPSALALTLFSLFLIISDKTTELSWAIPIATKLYHPQIFIVLFMLGLVVQFFFSVTLMTFAGTVSIFILDSVYFWITGNYWFIDSNIPPAVFLGLHLLITDPATSPKTNFGKVIFGGLYGASVFILFLVLDRIGQPTLYDKIIFVPILNLIWHRVDIVCIKIIGFLKKITPSILFHPITQSNKFHMGLWLAAFIYFVSSNFLGAQHPGTSADTWVKACQDGVKNGCTNLARFYFKDCRDGSGTGCNQLGILIKSHQNQIKVDKLKSAEFYFYSACMYSNLNGCQNFLNEFLFNPGVDKNFKAIDSVVQKVEKNCDQKVGNSCYLAGIAYNRGMGIGENKKHSALLFEKGCKLNIIKCCGKAGHMYLTGDGLPINITKAIQLFDSACNMNDAASCSYLGFIYQAGNGIEKSKDKALAYFNKACKLGLQDACGYLKQEGYLN